MQGGPFKLKTFQYQYKKINREMSSYYRIKLENHSLKTEYLHLHIHICTHTARSCVYVYIFMYIHIYKYRYIYIMECQ